MMDEKSDYLFVYSSLRKGFHTQGYEYISKYFSFVANATVKGSLKDTGSEPVGVPCDTATIFGELYQIKEPGQFSYVFGQLDEYEGLAPEAGDKKLYRRELVEVQVENIPAVKAWVYWYNLPAEDFPAIPSGDVMYYRS